MKKIYIFIVSIMLFVSCITINAFCAKYTELQLDTDISYTPKIQDVFVKTNVLVEDSDYNSIQYFRDDNILNVDNNDLNLDEITFNNDEKSLNISIEITNYNPNKNLVLSWSNILFTVGSFYTISGNGFTSIAKLKVLEYQESITLNFNINLFFAYKTSMKFNITNFELYFG